MYRVTRKPSWTRCGLLFSLFFQIYVCRCVCVCARAMLWYHEEHQGFQQVPNEQGQRKKKWQRMKRASMKEIKCRKERFKGLVHPMGKTWNVCLKANGLPEEDDKEKVRGERQKRRWWQINKDRFGNVGLERWNEVYLKKMKCEGEVRKTAVVFSILRGLNRIQLHSILWLSMQRHTVCAWCAVKTVCRCWL